MSTCLLCSFGAAAGKLAAVLREGLLSPAILASRLQCAVLDEADLLLSYGYEEDLALIAPAVRGQQAHEVMAPPMRA